MSYKFQDKLEKKANNFADYLNKKHDIFAETTMFRDYLVKMNIITDKDLGNIKIYYKPSKKKFNLHLDELNITDKNIKAALKKIWLMHKKHSRGVNNKSKSQARSKTPNKKGEKETFHQGGAETSVQGGAETETKLNPIEDQIGPQGAEMTIAELLRAKQPKVEYEIFTDGSCKEINGQWETSYGCAIYRHNELNELEDTLKGVVEDNLYKGSRQIGGEIMGVLKALEWCQTNDIKTVKISYDLALLEQWVAGEKEAKIPMAKEYVKLVSKSGLNIVWNKVKGHDGIEGNELADELAKEAFEDMTKPKETYSLKDVSSQVVPTPVDTIIQRLNEGMIILEDKTKDPLMTYSVEMCLRHNVALPSVYAHLVDGKLKVIHGEKMLIALKERLNVIEDPSATFVNIVIINGSENSIYTIQNVLEYIC